jgi:DNA-3-methyladenine glycosylase II
LPKGFRRNDVLAFHRRDSERIAERIDGKVLLKGLVWYGCPACLSLRFSAGSAAVELAIDGSVDPDSRESMKKMARRMLGLTQRIEVFERAYQAHPQIGSMVKRNAGLRVPLAPTPFEALTWAITGQQISVSAAVSVRRKLIQAVGLRHSGGLWCFPEARQIAGMTEAELRRLGFSKTKALTGSVRRKRMRFANNFSTSAVSVHGRSAMRCCADSAASTGRFMVMSLCGEICRCC